VSDAPAYRRRRLEPPLQRFERWVRGLRGGFHKRQRVYLVEIGGRRLKQIVLPDACVAAEIAHNLEHLADLALFPRMVARYRNELWVEFVEGEPLSARAPLEELAELFAALYRRDGRLVSRDERNFVDEARRDVAFLADAGVLDAGDAARLADAAARGAPALAWVGHDYGDPRPQNVLRTRSGALRIIDVESIRRDALIGTGVVRALMRWPAVDRRRLLAALRERGAPSFDAYFDFLEVAFVAAWTKRCVLHRKPGLVDRGLLARLAART
jgi:hypothetical protein